MSLEVQILQYNYWEHFKALKDISLVLPINHPIRVELEKATNDILKKIQKLKADGKAI